MTTYSGPRTLGAVVAARAAAGPDRVFIDFEDRTVTYGMLDDAANRFANRLCDLGIAKGDKVAIMLDNCPEFLAAWVGTAKAGIVEVPINTGYKGDLFAYLRSSQPVNY